MTARVLPFRWSDHALRNLVARHIDQKTADAVLQEPEVVADGRHGRKVYMGCYFDKDHGSEMLLRIVVEDVANEIVVVTLYKTSRVEKYLPTRKKGESV